MEEKTKEQLLEEIEILRRRVAKLKELETKAKKTEEELKAANQQLKASEQQLRAEIVKRKDVQGRLMYAEVEWWRTFNAISDFVFVLDKDNTIIKANQISLDRLKMKREDIVGEKCYEIIHKMGRPWPECPFEKTKDDKETHAQEIDDPNVGIPLLVITSPIFNSKKELIGTVHIAKDISRQKQIEGERKKYIHELEVFYMASVSREEKILALKQEVKRLKKELESKS